MFKGLQCIIAELWWPEGPPRGAPYSYKKRKGNPWVDFLMVIVASGIARGRVFTTAMTTTMESRNMAAILQIIGWQICSLGLPCTSLILEIHVMINWHLSKQGIYWPVSRDHIAGSSLQLLEVTCFFEVDRWPIAGYRLDRGLILGWLVGNRAGLFGSQFALTQD